MPLRPVREIMSGPPLCCTPGETVQEACRRMAESCCGHVLVCDGERLVGIFTERDLLNRVIAAGHDPARCPVEKAMTRNPVTIRADAPIREAIRVMDEGSFRYLPVLDGERLVGMISAKDLPYAEIAAVLGVPAGTVRSRIARGRRLLAEALDPGRDRSGNPAGPAGRQSWSR